MTATDVSTEKYPVQFEMTFARLLKRTSFELECLGVPNFEQEAWWILSFAAGRENAWLAAELPGPVPVSIGEKVEEIIRQRRFGRPLVYITGETEFYGLKLQVGPAVLIPRPETETLVAEVLGTLSQAAGRKPPFSILEIGTGSGCIALALLSQLPGARAVATDISREALGVAKENARGLGLEQKIQFLQGDLLEPIKAQERFDLVVSNPPYIDRSEMDSLDPSVRCFEPKLALESPEGGTWFHRQLARQGAALLRPGGILAFEVGDRQAGSVARFLKKTGLYEKPRIFPDPFGYERVVLARKN